MIYIASPVSAATGGTELLQQYCAIARQHGFNAVMYYYGDMPFEGSPVQKVFSHYGNPFEAEVLDNPSNALIVPEVSPELLKQYTSIKKVFWWESVDNYPGAAIKPSFRLLGLDKSMYRLTRRYLDHRTWYRHNREWCRYEFLHAIHFVQSEYARNYVIDNLFIPSERVLSVSDYVDTSYAVEPITGEYRINQVLFNPSKGIGVTRRIMAAGKGIMWLPLRGYTHDELRKLFQTSKVYIDFGNHPGKDRMPREAASAGCCVITNRNGAAANDVDVPIPSEYKFDDRFKPADVVSLILDCFDNYDVRSQDFSSYRQVINGEKERFESEVLRSLKVLEAM